MLLLAGSSPVKCRLLLLLLLLLLCRGIKLADSIHAATNLFPYTAPTLNTTVTPRAIAMEHTLEVAP